MLGSPGSNEPTKDSDFGFMSVVDDLMPFEEEHHSKDWSIVGPYSVEAPEPRD